jgi:SAM-dependent methyltransferase
MQQALPGNAGPRPAEIYDERFVPALFGPWGPEIARAAGAAPGARLLDVGCGTGALACAAARIVGPRGRVTGLDANPEMLAVARRKPEPVEWVEGVAEALPFGDGSFDAVASQFAFMFFDDPPAALAHMLRVLRPGGRMAVAVCDAVGRSPGYAAFSGLLRRLFGDAVADAFGAPFVMGDAGLLAAHARAAGLPGAEVVRMEGAVRFDSIAELVSTERACAWTLGGILDDDQFARLAADSETALAPFRDAAGRVRFTMPALVIRAERPA